jgi:malate dehydrogenase (oxaloacetate-decarboxylating)(NADP+)
MDVDLVNPENDPRYRDYWETYHGLMCRRGVSPDIARAVMRTNTTAIGAVMVHREEADCLICGTFGETRWHLNYVEQVLGRDGRRAHGALSMMILEDGPLFIADTQVHLHPDPQQLAEIAIGAARHVRRFGIEPKVAFCSQSQFGNQGEGSGKRLRAAIRLLDEMSPGFSYEGEMNIDTALDPELRERLLPGNRMSGPANVLIFAHADAASGVRNILKMKGGGLEVGPILMGMGNRAHIVSPAITARGLLNMSAIAGTPVAEYG